VSLAALEAEALVVLSRWIHPCAADPSTRSPLTAWLAGEARAELERRVLGDPATVLELPPWRGAELEAAARAAAELSGLALHLAAGERLGVVRPSPALGDVADFMADLAAELEDASGVGEGPCASTG
jgi:hypothetical protein